MNTGLRLLAWFFLLASATSLPAQVSFGKETAVEDAWRGYLTQDRTKPPTQRFPYQHCFKRAAEKHNLPLALLLAVARGESDFDPSARSHANALGLMQIQWPGTAHHLGIRRKSALYDPCTNVDAGTRYLKELMERYSGNLHRSLAAYNYGPGRIGEHGGPIPSGAVWYSSYIYRHLRYVLGENAGRVDSGKAYRSERKFPVIVFSAPYRAESFVQRMKRLTPFVRLDWFRSGDGRFKVVALYRGIEELKKGKRLLAEAGFPLG